LFKEKLIQKKALENKIPLTCHFDLTYRCNLKGRHCYIVRQDRPELNLAEIKDILNQLAEAGTLFLSLSGGEMFMRDDSFAIAEYARNLNFAVRLLTNGTLIDDAAIRRIKDLSPKQVTISIYSAKPSLHDEITGVPGSFNQAVRTAGRLVEKDIKVQFSCLLMKINSGEYSSVRRLSEKVGCGFQADPHVTPRIDGNISPLMYHIHENDLAKVLTDLIMNTAQADSSEERRSKDEFDDIPCFAAMTSCYISPYGDVFPCVQFPLICGNLRKRTFKDIWGHSPEFENIRNTRFSKLPVCSECELRSYCRRCPGIAWIIKNDFTAPYEMACREAEIIKKIETREVKYDRKTKPIKSGRKSKKEKKETLPETGIDFR
jgi:radical SAM protein with 4Fe4S-binding SPASM domain